MRQQLEPILCQIFENSDISLGTVERNTEIKVVFLTLWALGWDPVHEIACNFHISRHKINRGAKAAHAIDFALRDDVGLCVLGEVKHWGVAANGTKWELGVDQLRRYQQAVPAPRAFLSCGQRWLILNEHGEKLADIEAADGKTLIEQLTPYLAKGAVRGARCDDWEYGIWPSRRKRCSPPGLGTGTGETSLPVLRAVLKKART